MEILAAEVQELEIVQCIKTKVNMKNRKRTESKMCGRMVSKATLNQQLEFQVHLILGRIKTIDRVPSEISLAMFTLSRNQKRTNSHRD